MSDERRQTRLLPFQLRRGAAKRGELAGRSVDAPEDAELRELLRAWEAPAPSRAARGRVLQAFRAQAQPPPLWRRLLSARVNVPLPLAACAFVVLMALASALALRPATRVSLQAPASTNEVPALQVVETPGPERVVVRVVYVESKSGRDGRRAAKSSGVRPSLRDRAPARGREETARYFTRVNMAEFQPADEMTIRVIKKGEER